jgi:septum site-determining protein MinC
MTLWTVLAEREATREAARQLSLATRLPGSNADLNGNARRETASAAAAEDPAPAQDDMANSLLLRETLRSGRSVYHEGHVVIIGDVNPGAEIIAGGDVVVWGKLRGLVHAGAHGDSAAVICALALNPTQLRIAGQIAVAPGEKRRRPQPEQVRLIDNQLVAEEWNVK